MHQISRISPEGGEYSNSRPILHLDVDPGCVEPVASTLESRHGLLVTRLRWHSGNGA
jgi:hypothetical protein